MKYNAEHGYKTCEKHGNYHYTVLKKEDGKFLINSTCPDCRAENPNGNRIKKEILE